MEKYPEERQILIHPLPLVPVSKCMEGSSVLTDIIIGKFMYHLPFYRLTQQYRESGIGISESTMCGWYEMAVEKRKLLYNLLKQKILSSDYMQVDESVIPVMDNEKHKAKKGDEWCVRDGVTGDVMFHYDRITTKEVQFQLSTQERAGVITLVTDDDQMATVALIMPILLSA